MRTLTGAAEPPEGNPVAAWNGTAWWGWCPQCGVPFGNHNISCPRLTQPIPSTAANPVWPLNGTARAVTTAAANRATTWTLLNTASGR